MHAAPGFKRCIQIRARSELDAHPHLLRTTVGGPSPDERAPQAAAARGGARSAQDRAPCKPRPRRRASSNRRKPRPSAPAWRPSCRRRCKSPRAPPSSRRRLPGESSPRSRCNARQALNCSTDLSRRSSVSNDLYLLFKAESALGFVREQTFLTGERSGHGTGCGVGLSASRIGDRQWQFRLRRLRLQQIGEFEKNLFAVAVHVVGSHQFGSNFRVDQGEVAGIGVVARV